MTAPEDDQFRWHREALDDRGLTAAARLVAAALWDYFDPKRPDPHIHPGRDLLSERLGLSTRTVDRSLASLRESGWIVRVRRGSDNGRRKIADTYRLAYPDRDGADAPGPVVTHDEWSPGSLDTAGECSEDHWTPVSSDPDPITGHQRLDHSPPVSRTLDTSDSITRHQCLPNRPRTNQRTDQGTDHASPAASSSTTRAREEARERILDTLAEHPDGLTPSEIVMFTEDQDQAATVLAVEELYGHYAIVLRTVPGRGEVYRIADTTPTTTAPALTDAPGGFGTQVVTEKSAEEEELDPWSGQPASETYGGFGDSLSA